MREIKFRFYQPSRKAMITWRFSGDASDLIEEEDWKVMQFTGLLDKNGVEIYEGDIVQYEQFKGDIFWDYSGFMLRINKIVYAIWRDCEVIGNIYEGLHSGESRRQSHSGEMARITETI